MLRAGYTRPISHLLQQLLTGSRSAALLATTFNGKSKVAVTGMTYQEATGMKHGIHCITLIQILRISGVFRATVLTGHIAPGPILNRLQQQVVIAMPLHGPRQVISPRPQLSLAGMRLMEPIVTQYKSAYGVVAGMIYKVAHSTIHG